MAVLDEANRFELWARFMREPEVGETYEITKQQLRAAVDGLDDFLNANEGAINSAIPQPARGSLTTRQKARLLRYVVRQRYEVS